MYTVMPKTCMTDGTLLATFDYLAWAMNALLDGRMPERGWRGRRHPQAGRPLLRGRRAAVVQLRGGWEFYDQVLGLPRWDGVPHMCYMCGAQQGRGSDPAMHWTSATRNWVHTVKTHEGYLADLAARGEPVPKLFTIISLRLEGVMCDVLHVLDQGVTSHLIGNVRWEVMKGFLGGDGGSAGRAARGGPEEVARGQQSEADSPREADGCPR